MVVKWTFNYSVPYSVSRSTHTVRVYIYWLWCWWCVSPFQTSEHKFNVLSGLFFRFGNLLRSVSLLRTTLIIFLFILCSAFALLSRRIHEHATIYSPHQNVDLVCLFVHFHRSIELSINRDLVLGAHCRTIIKSTQWCCCWCCFCQLTLFHLFE